MQWARVWPAIERKRYRQTNLTSLNLYFYPEFHLTAQSCLESPPGGAHVHRNLNFKEFTPVVI